VASFLESYYQTHEYMLCLDEDEDADEHSINNQGGWCRYRHFEKPALTVRDLSESKPTNENRDPMSV
jgi:hypothetical protein